MNTPIDAKALDAIEIAQTLWAREDVQDALQSLRNGSCAEIYVLAVISQAVAEERKADADKLVKVEAACRSYLFAEEGKRLAKDGYQEACADREIRKARAELTQILGDDK